MAEKVIPQADLEEIRNELESIEDPGTLISRAAELAGSRAAIGTSGQLTGSAMIDMASSTGAKIRIFSIDTLRLFSETYYLFEEIYDRYQYRVEWFAPDQKEVARMISQHGEYLFFDSQAKQEYCCEVRKVHPNKKALESVDVWFTGLRRDQSSARSDTPRMSWVDQKDADGTVRQILKICPLVDWNEEMLRVYCREHDVPVHKLLSWKHKGWRYESLGCTICTTPTGPQEARRSGRWRWFNSQGGGDKECGIHLGSLGAGI